ncbi:MAG: exodeoxyribonuclease V subunit gamma [Pseudomonadota bacterium]|nr:exodeoxyribonuclease V subunit gamma [Pseudomonadota bacterium]
MLARQVAQLLADGDWLRPDVVLVPQFSMRRWLQQAIAERSGICANLRFLTPGEFVDAALDANLGVAPTADRLAPDALRWHLLRELRNDPPTALTGFVGTADPLRTWSLAGALADTFEKYQAWRRENVSGTIPDIRPASEKNGARAVRAANFQDQDVICQQGAGLLVPDKFNIASTKKADRRCNVPRHIDAQYRSSRYPGK